MVTVLESLLSSFLCFVGCFLKKIFVLSKLFCTYQIFIAYRRNPRNFDFRVRFWDNLWFIDNRPMTENIHRIHFSTFCFSFICTCTPYIQVVWNTCSRYWTQATEIVKQCYLYHHLYHVRLAVKTQIAVLTVMKMSFYSSLYK